MPKIKCNVENVNRVADAIEGHEFARLGFNMNDFVAKAEWVEGGDRSGHNCGTVACIAGWSLAVRQGRSVRVWGSGAWVKASGFLGMDYNASYRLFLPSGLPVSYSDVSPAVAVEVLRHLAKTGKIDWPRAIKKHPLVEERA